METDKIYHGNCLDVMKDMTDFFVDLVVTSPPYDKLRQYEGYSFDYKLVLKDLFRVLKEGGVLVWVVGDATINGSETGTSFRHALFAKECGFNLYDTMIYHKNGLVMNHRRYEQEFEYMFVFTKGKPKTFNPIRIPCKYPEPPTARKNSYYSLTDETNRKARSNKKRKPVGVDKIKGNVWYITTGKGHSTQDSIAFQHPAIFPERLARDHIISWSNEGDVVLDPMCGSGTTCKMAKELKRKYIGIDISEQYVEIANKRIQGLRD